MPLLWLAWPHLSQSIHSISIHQHSISMHSHLRNVFSNSFLYTKHAAVVCACISMVRVQYSSGEWLDTR